MMLSSASGQGWMQTWKKVLHQPVRLDLDCVDSACVDVECGSVHGRGGEGRRGGGDV